MLHTRAQVALRRGHDPAADALREVFQELLVDEQPLRRMGALIAGTDIRYPMPGSATTRWPAPSPPTSPCTPTRARPASRSSCTPHGPSSSTSPTAQTCGRPPETGSLASISTPSKPTDRPADALLIRPDAHIAWAVTIDEPTDSAAPALREALSGWFGTP